MSKSQKQSRSDGKLELAAAARWPVFECLVSTWWRDTAKLTEVIVAKEPPFGGVVCCAFLVDLGCLGLKEGFVTQFQTRREYETRFRSLMTSRNPKDVMGYPLAAKILLESTQYARQLGFAPSEPVKRALSALGELDAIAATCQEKIPLGGRNGKPFYVAGPQDDVYHGHADSALRKRELRLHHTGKSVPSGVLRMNAKDGKRGEAGSTWRICWPWNVIGHSAGVKRCL